MLHAMLVDVVMQNVIYITEQLFSDFDMLSATTLNDFLTSVVAPILTNTNFGANFLWMIFCFKNIVGILQVPYDYLTINLKLWLPQLN